MHNIIIVSWSRELRAADRNTGEKRRRRKKRGEGWTQCRFDTYIFVYICLSIYFIYLHVYT